MWALARARMRFVVAIGRPLLTGEWILPDYLPVRKHPALAEDVDAMVEVLRRRWLWMAGVVALLVLIIYAAAPSLIATLAPRCLVLWALTLTVPAVLFLADAWRLA